MQKLMVFAVKMGRDGMMFTGTVKKCITILSIPTMAKNK